MVAENGMEPAEECKNPPKHLPQAAGRAGTHMRPNRAAPSREMARCRFAAVVGSLASFSLMILLMFLHWCPPALVSGNWVIFPMRKHFQIMKQSNYQCDSCPPKNPH